MNHVFFIAFAGLISCNNQRSNSEKILNDFDSVSKSLEKTIVSVSKSTNTLYVELEKKFVDHEGWGKIKQMQYVIQDFYGFISDIETKFIINCGDSSGAMLPEAGLDNISLTNDFFLKRGNAAKLFHQMKNVQAILLLNVSDSLIRNKITNWIMTPNFEGGRNDEDKFTKGYFYTTPPVAATTILHKFENDVRVFENTILTSYLKQ